MGCITDSQHCFAAVIFCLQLVAVVERQVFDFFGFMWTCIAVNFVQIIIVIAGLFGVCQDRAKIIVLYLIWNFLWIAWNAFIICLYLSIGKLTKEDISMLNMATGSQSWWITHGYGCHADTAVTNVTTTTVLSPTTTTPSLSVAMPAALVGSTTVGMTTVATTVVATTAAVTTVGMTTVGTAIVGCLISYEYVEVLQAAIQCLLGFLGMIAACVLLNVLRIQYNASQLVSGELEYIRMQRPASSLDRRPTPQAPHPHQLYDVPRGSGVIRPTAKDSGSTAKDPFTRTPLDNAERRENSRRTPVPADWDPSPRPAPVVRAPGDDLPYAVSGMAMRLPPVGRRTQDTRTPYRPPNDQDEYGFIVAGNTQIPDATFI